MPATKELHVFGHRDDPDVDIGLPYDLENGEVFPHEKHHDFDIQNYSLILLIAWFLRQCSWHVLGWQKWE